MSKYFNIVEDRPHPTRQTGFEAKFEKPKSDISLLYDKFVVMSPLKSKFM